MYRFFGGSNCERVTATRKLAAANSFAAVSQVHGADKGYCYATTGATGVFIGKATEGQVVLLYLGTIFGSFPNWTTGAPIDDADRTARVLLQNYLQNGESFLDRVAGQFAVAVIDAGRDTVLLARDPNGGPRIFYSVSRNELHYSTHLVDFIGLMGEQWAVDRSLEEFFLGYEFLPDQRTLYDSVSVVPPGSIVAWTRGETSLRAIGPYVPDPKLLEAAQSRSEDMVIDALYEAFVASLNSQCPSQGKIGVLLGGFDSMLIAACLSRAGNEVETFTFRYVETGYTQAYVEEFCEYFKIRHNWVDITPDVIREGLEQFADRFNQPAGQAHYLIASAHAAGAMRDRGILHCITGDGCDGLFLGYPTVHARARLIQSLSSVAVVLGPLIQLFGRFVFLEKRLGHPYRFFRNIGRVLRRPMPARGHIAACTLDEVSVSALRHDAPEQDEAVEHILRRLASGLETVSPIRLAYLGKGCVGLNANKLEGISACSGVTFTSPYLHPCMSAIAGKIPDELNRPADPNRAQNTGKYIFMAMVDKYDLLPARFVHQKKMSPVTAPVDEWYWSSLREFMLDSMQDLPFVTDREYALSLVTEKKAEQWFRQYVGISRYVSQAASLLVTYARFTRFQSRP